jgi:hypothetical protein
MTSDLHDQGGYDAPKDAIDALGAPVSDGDNIVDNEGNVLGTLSGVGDAPPQAPVRKPKSLMDELEQRQTADPASGLSAKFEGKSREDVLKSYGELEGRLGELRRQVGVSKQFLDKIKHFFISDENGHPQVNDNMMYLYGAQKGWYKPNMDGASTPPQQGQRSQMQGDNSFADMLDENPEQAIECKIQSVVEKALKDGLEPLRKSVVEDRYVAWSERMRGKYKDYDRYEPKMHEIAQKFKIPLGDMQTFEDVYHWAKATSGGYVDKESALSELDGLRKSRSVMKPEQNFPVLNEAEAPVEDLIGGIAPMNDADAKIMRGLFGKGFLTPD